MGNKGGRETNCIKPHTAQVGIQEVPTTMNRMKEREEIISNKKREQ